MFATALYSQHQIKRDFVPNKHRNTFYETEDGFKYLDAAAE